MDITNIDGFSETKGDYNYWEDAVRDYWAYTGNDTDEFELREIIKWFDERRRMPNWDEIEPDIGYFHLTSALITNEDIVRLEKLTKLVELDLSNTQVTDLSPLANLTKLRNLCLYNTPVTDLSPLKGLRNLEHLGLHGTTVTEKEMQKLAKSLPNCRIELPRDRIKGVEPRDTTDHQRFKVIYEGKSTRIISMPENYFSEDERRFKTFEQAQTSAVQHLEERIKSLKGRIKSASKHDNIKRSAGAKRFIANNVARWNKTISECQEALTTIQGGGFNLKG